MQIILNDTESHQVEAGDLVIYHMEDILCIVGEDNTASKYPYPIISIQTGRIVDKYVELEYVLKDCDLVAKNKDITLTCKKV